MHYIQKQILDQLRTQSTARYAELQPDGVESSHFKYHLNILIADGLVAHISRGTYVLTDRGQAHVDKLSAGRVNAHDTPKVITYTLIADDTHYYLYRKEKDPYRNQVNMVGGKLHIGETATAASQRELSEKLGIDDDVPEVIGVANIRITLGGKPFTHVIAYICQVTVTAPIHHSRVVTVAKSDLATPTELAPDFHAVMQMVASPQHAIRDITIELNDI